MKLIANWRAVLLHAWSIRFIAAALFFGALELAVPYLDGVLPIQRGMFALLVIVINLAAGISRIVSQRKTREGER